jgi:hypothetical protein
VKPLAALLAASLQLKKFILEGGSLTVIAALDQPSLTVDWKIFPIMSAILCTIPTSSWEVRKVY